MRCTMIVIGSEGTADGSTLICHNHEAWPAIPQRLDVVPRKEYAEGATRDCGFEKIPQVPLTFGYVGARYWPEPGPQSDFCSGVNEWGVTITCNGEQSREPLPPAKTGVPWHHLTELPMERARTAREAVELLGWLVDTFGCPPNPGFDIIGGENSWVVADQSEAWYVECSYRHWVARKVRPDDFLALCNRYSLSTDFDLHSEDVVTYAEEQGWYDPASDEPFSWRDAYGVKAFQDAPVYDYLVGCMHAQLDAKWGEITLEDCFSAMRDHGEGTPLAPESGSPNVLPEPEEFDENAPLVAWRPLRPYCSALTSGSFVYQLRPGLPPEVGVTMWYHMATSCSSVNVPIYPGTPALPEPYTRADVTDKADDTSAWWRFKSLADNVDQDFSARHDIVASAWAAFERQELSQLPQLEKDALKLLETGDADGAKALLGDYTVSRLDDAYETAGRLSQGILTSPAVVSGAS